MNAEEQYVVTNTYQFVIYALPYRNWTCLLLYFHRFIQKRKSFFIIKGFVSSSAKNKATVILHKFLGKQKTRVKSGQLLITWEAN